MLNYLVSRDDIINNKIYYIISNAWIYIVISLYRLVLIAYKVLICTITFLFKNNIRNFCWKLVNLSFENKLLNSTLIYFTFL